jgi:hypothetical protein
MKKILLVIGWLLFLGGASSAFAYEVQFIEDTPVKEDFVLGPGKTDLVLDPGDKTTKQLTVTNRLGKDTKFKIEIEDFAGSYDTDQTVKLFGDVEGPYSMKDYLHPEIYEFSLKHGERIILPIEIEIPEDSESGGLYASVLVSTVPSEAETEKNKGQTKLISRLGTLFFVRVSGDVYESGFLQDFKISDSSKTFYEKGPIPFEIMFKNEGNIHIMPSGKIEVTNFLGKKVAELEVDSYFSMPDSVRKRVINWERENLFGFYTAHLTLDKNYQIEQNESEERSVSFWVIPWKIILVAVFALYILIFILKKILGSFKFEIKKK